MNGTVLLVSLQKDTDVVGLKCLHYRLMANSWRSALLFAPLYGSESRREEADAAVCRFARGLRPLFIGISLMSVEYRDACRLTRSLKAVLPDVPVVWGGIHPTIAPETCLDYADYVCVGEGDDAVLELAAKLSRGRSPRDVGNICYRSGGELVRNPLNKPVADLDGLEPYEHVPRSAFVLDGVRIARLTSGMFRKYARYGGTTCSIISSRGCPFSCTYCCNNALSSIYGKKRVRFKSAEALVSEVKYAVADTPWVDCINFQDDCFLARNDKDIAEFAAIYKREVAKPFVIRSIPTFVTREKLERLKEAGLSWISLGLQSGSDDTCLKIYKRKSTRTEFLDAAKIVSDLRVAAFYDVILDNPFETDEAVIETARTLMETPKPYYTQFFSLALYPGTALHEKALEQKLIRGDEYQTKDYLQYARTTPNELVRLAAFLGKGRMEKLLKSYEADPESGAFKFGMAIAKLLALALHEPLTYLRVIRLSQNGSLIRTLRAIPSYVREGLMRFGKQFANDGEA